MKERSFDEMIAYFNRRVADMDISQDSKMELLGMVTALGFKHEKSAQQWIPCSERLPERDEIVLVSYKTTDKVHMCKYLDDGSENPWWSYNDDCLAWNNVVLAWMPLPEPFKGGGL